MEQRDLLFLDDYAMLAAADTKKALWGKKPRTA
jgi:hypothetical protein